MLGEAAKTEKDAERYFERYMARHRCGRRRRWSRSMPPTSAR